MSLSRQIPPAGAIARKTADMINELARGKLDSIGEVTLTANVASSTVTTAGAIFCHSASAIFLFPLSANAAAEVGGGTLYVSARAAGSFTLAHANNAQIDRTFCYVVIG
mgnify:CR=1 FL=1